jgi:hypothetical protein
MPPTRGKPKKAEKGPAQTGRPVKYPEVEVRLLAGKDALTVEQVKEILGWEEETDEVKFGRDYLLVDTDGRKVRCANNTGNRPFYQSLAESYAQELLKKRWSGPNGNGKSVNGEPIIIGKTGECISLQHRGVGLVLAEQMRVGKDAEHWAMYWKGPVVMDTVAVFGVDEDDEVVNTIDTGKSRTDVDMLYRMPYFASQPPAERRVRSRALAYAVKVLWERTGARKDPYAPNRTHAELVDFIERHRRLVKAVEHLADENEDNAVSGKLPLGYAAGLLYLMGCSETDPGAYYDTPRDERTEKVLSWKQWDAACDFWVLLAKGSPDVHEVKMALNGLDDPTSGRRGSTSNKIAVLLKAWNEYVAGGALTAKNLELRFGPMDDNGVSPLLEVPTAGGIDRGPRGEAGEEEASDVAEGEVDPTPEQIEERKREVLRARENPASFETAVKRLWEANPGKFLFLRSSKGNYVAFGKDATALANLLKVKPDKHDSGLLKSSVSEVDLKDALAKLHADGRKVACVYPDAEGNPGEVKDLTPPPVPKARPTPGGKKDAPQRAKGPTPGKAKKGDDLKAKQLEKLMDLNPDGSAKF